MDKVELSNDLIMTMEDIANHVKNGAIVVSDENMEAMEKDLDTATKTEDPIPPDEFKKMKEISEFIEGSERINIAGTDKYAHIKR